tara:strand:- start:745 stop:1041 length:297 start_codon:yes stop_codon:yes gene_type:complete
LQVRVLPGVLTQKEKGKLMAHVITEPCIGTKDGACAEVCPVDCIHTDEESNQFFIDADECIDCGLCISECPVSAIYYEEDILPEMQKYIQINIDFFKK